MLNQDETFDSQRTCCALVERYAPLLMKLGGGISGEFTHRPSTAEERARAIALYTANGHDIKATASALSRSFDWARRVVKAAGLPTRRPGYQRSSKEARA